MATLEDYTPKSSIRIGGSVGHGGDNAIADVIAVEIHLNIFILNGAVKGVSKPLFTVGQMTEPYKAAIRAFQRSVAGMSKPDGRIDPNGTTLKYLNGPITAKKGKVKPDPVVPSADVAAALDRIVKTARKYLLQGGHFLNGSMGDSPGRADGHPTRLAFTRPATFMDGSHPRRLGPAVNAAWVPSRLFGSLGCMGRPGKAGITNHKILPGDPRDLLIPDYMATVRRMKDKGIPSNRWPGFDIYRAHTAEFDRATTYNQLTALTGKYGIGKQFPRRINPDGAIHLGEACFGHRHYDCVGFVNWVLSKVLRPKWSFSLDWYRTPDSAKPFKIIELKDPSDIHALAQVGDIVVKPPGERHCGFVTKLSGELVVTNCRSMAEGLINSKLTAEWGFVARLRSV